MLKQDVNIVIIGVGQLGSRHLQGLTRIKQEINITVIDPNPTSLGIARDRYSKMPNNPLILSVNYLKSIDQLHNPIDVAIIATNSDVRRKVIEDLLNQSQLKYLILEKVVFQSVDDFDVVNLINKKGIDAWVNCPRRLHPFFSELKNLMVNRTHRYIKVKGSKWGLASNTIHFLDLFSFLFGVQDISIDTSELHPKIYRAKRKGFIELGGTVTFIGSRGDCLCLTDNMQHTESGTMEFGFNKNKVSIIDNYNKRYTQYNLKEEDIKHGDFVMPLQSELTGSVVEAILTNGTSGLTPFDESRKLHIPMLKGFIDHIKEYNESAENQEFCPIT